MHVRKRGLSLVLVLVLVSVLAFLSAAMTGLFLMNLNYTQGNFNADIALGQTEAALGEVLYRLGQDEQASFGSAQSEQVSGTISTDLTMGESSYLITFQPGMQPYSTNNVDGSRPTGYNGRQIPKGAVHVIARGHCRGQLRWLEALVVKPQCPYGLATSGPIHSRTPLSVVGVTSAAEAIAGQEDRPGHIVSNSPDGIKVDSAPGKSTYISGFVKAVGPVRIGQPADVRGGIRELSSASALPKLNLSEFDPDLAGMTGFMRITEAELPATAMDILYYSDHSLVYQGSMQMNNAFLYVNGDLIVNGGVGGVGAIVASGNVTINGGADLKADNSVALLAGGEVKLRGGGSFFQGFLYSQKGLDASDLTVVGTALVDGGGADLDEVKFIADESKGNISVTVDSYSQAGRQTQAATASAIMSWGYREPNSPEKKGTSSGPDSANRAALTQTLLGSPTPNVSPDSTFYGEFGAATTINFTPPAGYDGPTMTGVMDALYNLKQSIGTLQAAEPDSPDAETALTETGKLYEIYALAVRRFSDEYWLWYDRTADRDGAIRLRDGALPPDFQKTFTFDLNRYMPRSDRIQVSSWRLSTSL